MTEAEQATESSALVLIVVMAVAVVVTIAVMMMAEAQRKPAAEVLRKLEQDGDKRAGPEPGKHSLERGQEGKDAAVAAELHGDKAPELELPGEGTRAARQEDADASGALGSFFLLLLLLAAALVPLESRDFLMGNAIDDIQTID
ncbi:hypothetical protein PI126_g7598 [Phytophthora idaei]|nr:hypothetical protein PI126_g7598 [Phytophthora idaei]